MSRQLHIQNLHASVSGAQILKGFNLTVKPGEIHAIMGPNGAGKSTLAKVIAGHSAYEVTEGAVTLNGEDLLEKEPEDRAHAGLFMSFQYPVEVPGVNNVQFLKAALQAKRKAMNLPALTDAEFQERLEEKMRLMEIRPEFTSRSVNEGFSGGEKKRNEILQMALLNPEYAILDETDSGLDIDAIKVVSHALKTLMNKQLGIVLITHYQRLLHYIPPHFVHVMIDGRIVRSGGASLAWELESRGYDWLTPNHNANAARDL